jgi:hypothetical protein
MDHLDSLRTVADSSGNIQEEMDFDNYGRATILKMNVDADFGFAGYYHYAPSDLNLAAYRLYTATTLLPNSAGLGFGHFHVTETKRHIHRIAIDVDAFYESPNDTALCLKV